MMDEDPTEVARTLMVKEINENPRDREALEEKFGQVWDTQELQADFKVKGFLAPFVGVVRKADDVEGSLLFQHWPRFYFGFTANDDL